MDKLRKFLMSLTNGKRNKRISIDSQSEQVKATACSTILSIHGSIRSHRQPDARIVQNIPLIWLDSNIDEVNNSDCRNTIIQLRQVVNAVNTFTDNDACISFIGNFKEGKVFMICSGTLGQATVPVVHDMPEINSIYIFCENMAKHEQWTKQWRKIQGVYTDIALICEALRQVTQEHDRNTISMSFIPTTNETPKQNLNELDQSFMYTQILKEILLTIDFGQEHFMNFITHCRERFVDDATELIHINKLEKEYSQHAPIWWYTYPCFLFSMLNGALRTMEVDIIIKMGFFVRDLHQQIAQLHYKQYADHDHSHPFTVYRGQGLSSIDLNQLKNLKGELLSFNSFLSTSKDRDVSLRFARRTAADGADLMGIVFAMTIDPSISSTHFADICDVSRYQTEEEILFSMHSIFRIGKVKQIDHSSNRLWQVELILTSDNDPQLHALTEFMREESFPDEKGWYRLGNLLIKLGQFNKAEQVYEVLLDQTTDDREKSSIYQMLGWIKDDQGEYTKAITFYEKSLEIDGRILPSTHADLATSYNNIGLVYDKMGEYLKALLFFEKALEIRQKTLPSNHPDLSTSYNNIGSMCETIGDYSKALLFYEKDLKISQKILPSNHPDLSTPYNNIGAVYDAKGDYTKALSFYGKALEIRQKTLPPNHHRLATSYNNIGLVYGKMREHSKALSYCEKALEIYENTLSSNHPNLAACYDNIGSVYYDMSDYAGAFMSHEKALEIRQQILPRNHLDLATSYNNIALVYKQIGEYSKALSYCEKDLEIREKNLPSKHPSLATSYNNMGQVLNKMGDYWEALAFFERAIEVGQSSLSADHPDLQQYRKNLESLRKYL